MVVAVDGVVVVQMDVPWVVVVEFVLGIPLWVVEACPGNVVAAAVVVVVVVDRMDALAGA